MLKDFLPHGQIWRKNGTTLNDVLSSLDVEFDRVESSIRNLITESNPLTTTLMLDAREVEAGLPDECTGELTTLQARRSALVSRWSLVGGATKQYIIDAAALQGYTITIEDGIIPHTFTVHAEDEVVLYFRTGGSQVGERLATWGNDTLECLIHNIKPAHTIVVFAYDL